ncbi:hypothetical protein ZTR_03704 [Talaromyces verruculosus]|nr:hypothetical protein ZTR_03704 [Talaromyces verruculosus]
MPALLPHQFRRNFDLSVPKGEFLDQWVNPSDIFTALLILGGEVMGCPVDILGWVVFSVRSALSALARKGILPEADFECIVVNAKPGWITANRSWVIGRLWRDFDNWMSTTIGDLLNSMLDAKFEEEKSKERTFFPDSEIDIPRPTRTGLCIAVYKEDPRSRGLVGRDRLYYIGFAVCIIQIGIAAIPLGIFGDWSIFLITTAGVILSFTSYSIHQWGKEKQGPRANIERPVFITRGNGSQFAILILGSREGVDFQRLAAGEELQVTRFVQIQITVLAVLWVVLLITATGIKAHTWFLFAVCTIGTLQNIYVAITWRSPEAYGIPLNFVEVIGNTKAMETLFAVEEKYPYSGLSMLDIFYPGRLFTAELERWNALRDSAPERRFRETQ